MWSISSLLFHPLRHAMVHRHSDRLAVLRLRVGQFHRKKNGCTTRRQHGKPWLTETYLDLLIFRVLLLHRRTGPFECFRPPFQGEK